jgi:hypothetical protein
MTNNIFATAINCIDGRAQIPVIDWLRRQYGVDYVDMITEPGPERLLAEAKDLTACASIRRRLEISINRHNSNLVAIAGHHDCAGNPVDRETKLEQIFIAIKTVESWNFKVRVIGIWVDENWEVHQLNRGNMK